MALRTPLSVTPHLYMGDSTGRPLDKGVVYFGEQDKDPEFYPINLFSDDALTKPLAQPVHTKGGYLYDKGDMVEPHAKELIYSVKVLDSYGRKVFYKGAMMRNSWNDDVIEQINTAIISSADVARQVATDITNDAINNTAIEGGVLADTFVTATAKGVGAIARTQRDVNADTVHIKDFTNMQAAVDHLKTLGGGTLKFDSGRHIGHVVIDSPNIMLQGDVGTIINTDTSSPVVQVLEGGTGFKLDQLDLRGQSIEQEGLSNNGGAVINTAALHCIEIREKGAVLTNFKTSGARYDGLYVSYIGKVNLVVKNFYLGSCARNPLSIVGGEDILFENGTIYLDNTFTSKKTGVYDLSGLYLVDFEPNIPTEIYRDIRFKDVKFINNGTNPDNWQIKFEKNNIAGNNVDTIFEDCKFLKGALAGSTAPSIRAGTSVPSSILSGIKFSRCEFDTRVFSIAGSTLATIQDCVLEHVTVGISFAHGVTVGKGCIISDTHKKDGTAVTGVLMSSNNDYTFRNFSHYPDTVTKLTVTSKLVSPKVAEFGTSSIEARALVTESLEFIDVLKIGTRAGYKITVCGGDSTAGNVAMYFAETYAVTSGTATNYGTPPVNVIIDSENGGVLQWKPSAVGTLQFKTKNPAANIYIIKVEIMSGFLGGVSDVTWYI